ncbi:MAG: hypothetical protein CVT67_07195 [Actinobacteria bacterium HGW-Actinobacteria-7]|nr:MAG: hypothetical protein CVT67_07195 [Actinobacteria bacterium HGW-Actinobacteria-7]
MALPLDIRDLVSSGAKLRKEREKLVRLAVYIDAEAPESAVEALRQALRPQMSTARLHVEPIVVGDVLVVDDSADAVIALTGPGAAIAPSLARARDRLIPTLALALGETRDDVSDRLGHPLLDTAVADEPDELVAHLGTWLADRVSGKRLALAANFAFVRRAVSVEAVKNTALQNGLIGGVMIIPGADMPLMTANQAKMLMQIAAAYGEPLGVERIKELVAVVGSGFALRTVARQALTLIPGFGWAIKAGVGYSGTLAMGYAALEYFESGGDVRGLADKVRDARDRALELAKRRRGSIDASGATRTLAEENPVTTVNPGLPPASGPSGESAAQ